MNYQQDDIPEVDPGDVRRILSSDIFSLDLFANGIAIFKEQGHENRNVFWTVDYKPKNECELYPRGRRFLCVNSEKVPANGEIFKESTEIIFANLDLVKIVEDRRLELISASLSFSNSCFFSPELATSELFDFTIKMSPGEQIAYSLKLNTPWIDYIPNNFDNKYIDNRGFSEEINIEEGTNTVLQFLTTQDGQIRCVKWSEKTYNSHTVLTCIDLKGIRHRIDMSSNIKISPRLVESIYSGNTVLFEGIVIESSKY